MENHNTILSQNTIDLSSIFYDDIIMTQNDQFAVAKIWYKPSQNEMHSMFYQTSTLPIYSYDTKTNKFLLQLNGKNEQNILSEIDKLSINYIKSENLVKRLSLSPKTVKYRTIVQDFINKENDRINSFELKHTLKTKYYSHGLKKSKTLEDVESMLKKGTNIKAIFEFDGLIVDIKKETIFTNIILHQFKIEKIIPKRFELCEYSFLESDNDENVDEIKYSNNVKSDKESSDELSEEIVQNIAKNDIIEIDDNEDVISSDSDNEINSYEEESSEDINVEEFVSKLKETELKKEITLAKPKRGRPSKNST